MFAAMWPIVCWCTVDNTKNEITLLGFVVGAGGGVFTKSVWESRTVSQGRKSYAVCRKYTSVGRTSERLVVPVQKELRVGPRDVSLNSNHSCKVIRIVKIYMRFKRVYTLIWLIVIYHLYRSTKICLLIMRNRGCTLVYTYITYAT